MSKFLQISQESNDILLCMEINDHCQNVRLVFPHVADRHDVLVHFSAIITGLKVFSLDEFLAH